MGEDLARLQGEMAGIEASMASLESQRAELGDAVIDAALVPLRAQFEEKQALVSALAAAQRGEIAPDEPPGNIVVTGDGARIVIGEEAVETTAVERGSLLDRYLRYVIGRNGYLQLHGIRSGGKLVHIELERIYIPLRATRQHMLQAEEKWLQATAELALGKPVARHLEEPRLRSETVTVNDALAAYPRLVVLGDPGSGKTTLLRYLALLYARDLAAGTELVQERLGLKERDRLPILLPLRRLGAYLKSRRPEEEGTEGCALLLDHLYRMLEREGLFAAADLPLAEVAACYREGLTQLRGRLGQGHPRYRDVLVYEQQLVENITQSQQHGDTETRQAERSRVIDWLNDLSLAVLEVSFSELCGLDSRLPALREAGHFFEYYLKQGRAVVFLDGLDEVADPDLRRRVSRLVEAFTAAYPHCRYVVTCRIVGYKGPARLEGYTTTIVRDFRLADVEQFLKNWHLAVALAQMGPGEGARLYAERQSSRLLAAIEKNERIRELALNPLMLTVIALVHRDRVKLPDRRAEFYDEAVSVLLGKWEEAKGLRETPILDDSSFDAGDKRLLLQSVALWMQRRQQKEVEVGELRPLLQGMFLDVTGEERAAEKAVERFLLVIQERSGLLGEHGLGVYRFSHLTFQEYLAALAVAGRDDYVEYSLERIGDPWWREVILLETGHLSTQSRQRTTRLIQAIAEYKEEPEPYYNLVLALDCLRDVGGGRVEGNVVAQVKQRLRQALESRPPAWSRVLGKRRTRLWIEQRGAALEALARAGTGYWTQPYGEPEWAEVPAGEFWMGEGDDLHRVSLDTFLISRVPVTNAQYRLFTRAAGHKPPEHWEEGRPPWGKESHPVVYVTWHDAMAYCEWLSKVTGNRIVLPSEAEWEKAARGNKDKRIYPWGDTFEATRCNTRELGLGGTSPVGVFPDGASPYGVLDMAGNVWEWTRILKKPYPYRPDDGREDLEAEGIRALRGGSWDLNRGRGRCSFRGGVDPHYGDNSIGFRVALSPAL